jgi:mannosyltransferase OCH1-like enzyme
MRADLLRVAVLYLFGGIYVDADEDCQQPIDPLLDRISQVLLYRVAGMVLDGIQTWRIRNDFLAAIPGSRFFGYLLSTILSNIVDPTSNNVWAVTGPGALTSLIAKIDDLRPYGITIIERDHMFTFSRPNSIANGEQVHWSKQQEQQRIVKFNSQPRVKSGLFNALYI